jgi:hypothetical protein
MSTIQITIPRVLGQVSTEMVVRSFSAKKIGKVVSVSRHNRTNSNGHDYWFAFISLSPFNTPQSRAFVQLMKAGKKAFVFYTSDAPWTAHAQFPVLTSSVQRDPFVEVTMHIRDLVVTNPAAMVHMPAALKLKKGIAITAAVLKKEKKDRRQEIMTSDGWVQVGGQKRVSPAIEKTPEPTILPLQEGDLCGASLEDVSPCETCETCEICEWATCTSIDASWHHNTFWNNDQDAMDMVELQREIDVMLRGYDNPTQRMDYAKMLC